MDRPELHICHLYPDLMNLYGDRGNVIVLHRRSLWHGLDVHIHQVSLDEVVDFTRFDIVFIGGGQDREQKLICIDFQRAKGSALSEAIEDGVAVLAVCGGYQLLGKYYQTGNGDKVPGIGALDVWTVAGKRRMIGNVVIETDLFGERRTVVGFENHSGKTYLGKGLRPFGRVLVGSGNNGEDRQEGVVYRNVIGTYLHGSVLPKNPALADWLLQRGLDHRHGQGALRLQPLDDSREEMAHQAAVRRAHRPAH